MHPQLVTKAKELVDKLAFSWVGVSFSSIQFRSRSNAFNKASDIPYGHIDFSTNTPQKATVCSPLLLSYPILIVPHPSRILPKLEP